MALRPRRTRPDLVAAWAVATGVGLIAVMIAWSVGSRATTIAWGTTVGPSIALVGATVVGGLVGSLMGRRLVRSLRAADRRAARPPAGTGHLPRIEGPRTHP